MIPIGACNILVGDNKTDSLDYRNLYKIDLGLKEIQEIEKKDFHSDDELDNLCQNIFTKRFGTLKGLRPYRQ